MKKIVFTIVLLTSMNLFSQEKSENHKAKNEFKVNLATFIAGFPEFTFERMLSDESAFGITVGFSIGDNVNDEDNNSYNFSFIPYYRVYFGEKPNEGFFVDGNLALYSQKYRDGDFFANEKEGGVGFGLGFNVGKKYKTKNGWVAEFSFGISRTLINAEKINLIYPRGGIIIGKIF
jgi:hypothetical protein